MPFNWPDGTAFNRGAGAPMTAPGAGEAGDGGVGIIPTDLKLGAVILRLGDALDWALVTDSTEDWPSKAAATAKVQVLQEVIVRDAFS
jgi:hypothetical protein